MFKYCVPEEASCFEGMQPHKRIQVNLSIFKPNERVEPHAPTDAAQLGRQVFTGQHAQSNLLQLQLQQTEVVSEGLSKSKKSSKWYWSRLTFKHKNKWCIIS